MQLHALLCTNNFSLLVVYNIVYFSLLFLLYPVVIFRWILVFTPKNQWNWPLVSKNKTKIWTKKIVEAMMHTPYENWILFNTRNEIERKKKIENFFPFFLFFCYSIQSVFNSMSVLVCVSKYIVCNYTQCNTHYCLRHFFLVETLVLIKFILFQFQACLSVILWFFVRFFLFSFFTRIDFYLLKSIFSVFILHTVKLYYFHYFFFLYHFCVFDFLCEIESCTRIEMKIFLFITSNKKKK